MSIRIAIILVFLLAVAAGAAIIIRSQTEEPPETQSKFFLYRLDPFEVSSVQVTYRGEIQRFKIGEENTWIFDDGTLAVAPDRWGGVVGLLAEPEARRLVMETIDDPTLYGLDDPPTNIQVGLTDGQTLTFHLGELTATGDSLYAQLEGSSKLYTMAAQWESVFSRFVNDPPYLWLCQNDSEPGEVPSPIHPTQFMDITVTHEGVARRYTKLEDAWVLDDGPNTPVGQDSLQQATGELGCIKIYRLIPREFGPLKYGLGSKTKTHIELGLGGKRKIGISLGDIIDDGAHQYAELDDDDSERLFLIDTSFGEKFISLVTNPPVLPTG